MVEDTKRKRLRFQFSLRSLLLLTVVFGVLMSWVAARLREARLQQDGIAAVRAMGGSVYYSRFGLGGELVEETFGMVPKWVRQSLGDGFFGDVRFVNLDARGFDGACVPPPRPVDDEFLPKLKGLRHLRSLALGESKVSDDGLRALADFPELEDIGLQGTGITDAGLKQLPALRRLSLDDTRVSDAGLSHLTRMTGLEELRLEGCQVTGPGLACLAGLPRLRRLGLRGPLITDATLKHIKRLPQLEWLDLDEANITDEGLANLVSLTQLKGLSLLGTHITDAGAEQLGQLHELEDLDICGTDITKEGFRKLQEKLPKCRIAAYREVRDPP